MSASASGSRNGRLAAIAKAPLPLISLRMKFKFTNIDEIEDPSEAHQIAYHHVAPLCESFSPITIGSSAEVDNEDDDDGGEGGFDEASIPKPAGEPGTSKTNGGWVPGKYLPTQFPSDFGSTFKGFYVSVRISYEHIKDKAVSHELDMKVSYRQQDKAKVRLIVGEASDAMSFVVCEC
ncbi:hypothetical protein HGRIS_011855 [Hohenbuehelia grisea]|uniref:Uncharacterized protein n=1 Tax=Hohenbuehelia grisea TaxID=104357 RepID=A0ABR3JYN1_9AGAR